MMEPVTFAALEKHYSEWFCSDIDIHVMPDGALFLARTNCGRRLIVTSYYFTAFAGETSTETRFKSIQAYFTCLSLLDASGNVTPQEVSRQQSILYSFLMGLEGINVAPNDETKDADNDSSNDDDCDWCDDDADGSPGSESSGYRAARLLATPKGDFAGPGPGILVVSKYLKIVYAEILFNRE
jgi:hypothetical protein